MVCGKYDGSADFSANLIKSNYAYNFGRGLMGT